MRRLVKSIFSKNLFLPLAASRKFIFVYHDVSNETDAHFSAEHYSTSVENFRRQIKFLSQKFELIPLDALVTNDEPSRKKHYASIVFDDGFSSIIKNALPILRAHHIPFSIFVNKSAAVYDQLWISNLIVHRNDESYLRKIYEHSIKRKVSFSEFAADPINAAMRFQNFDGDFRQTYLREGHAGREKIYLDADEIRQINRDGVLIGSHSTDHYFLSGCDAPELAVQIDENERFLEDLLGKKIEHFAIPFGKNDSYDSETLNAIVAGSNKFSYSTNPVSFKSDSLENIENDSFLFPRIGILNQSPAEIMFYINRTFVKNYDL